MSTLPTHEQIAVLAFERYASRGYTNGHDQDDWYWAEASLRAQAGHASTPAHEHGHHEHGHHHAHEHQHGAHDTRHHH